MTVIGLLFDNCYHRFSIVFYQEYINRYIKIKNNNTTVMQLNLTTAIKKLVVYRNMVSVAKVMTATLIIGCM